jgi:N-acylneuraminate cytidylyltransferase
VSAVAFVPVRGGSRGIPRKNVRSFCGRPLLHWCLRALQQARGIDRVVVATDSDEIAATALKSGCAKVEIYRRSAASATDEASTETVVLEYLARASLPHDAVFVLVQATSPFTRPSDFEGALALLAGAGADAVLSCARSRRFFWDDAGRPINYDPRQRPRRQEFAGWLMENGAFYVSRAGAIQTSRSRLSGRVVPYEMPAHSGLELDDEDDWAAGEALMRRHCLPRRADAGSIRLVLTDVDGVLTDGGM